jgi:hypothetical protein
LTLGRPPTEQETSGWQAHRQSLDARLEKSGVPEDRRSLAVWASLARVLFASNEFLYFD